MTSITERLHAISRIAGVPRGAPPALPPADVAARAAVLRRLELEVTRRLDGMLTGDHLAASAGPGTEPSTPRPYGPGDDARRIDWSLTARSAAPHIRTTEADRELVTWVVVDRSSSLDFGTVAREKREVALAAVAAFGFLTVRAGNRVGVVATGGGELRWLPARSGRRNLMAALAAVDSTPRQPSAPAAGATLSAALTQLERTHRRRGQVVVISDFLDEATWAPPLRRLSLRHHVVAVQVSDPREHTLPDVGLLSVVDPETGRQLHVHTGSAGLRQRYVTAAAARHLQVAQSIAGAGATHLRLSTDGDWLLDVVRFVRRQRAERYARPAVVRRAVDGNATNAGPPT